MINHSEFLASIGFSIRKMRKEKGLNQTRLAELCDFDKASISRIEAGRTNPTTLTLKKIADSLEVHMSHFFNGHT